MLLFWALAALLAGGAAVLILTLAARAERRSEGPDPALQVYRRQLTELDDLAERGLLGEAEQRAARAEAGRRLLAEADHAAPTGPADAVRWGRRWALAAAMIAPLLALGGYLVAGSPGLPDQPYRERLKAWRSADPGALGPAEMGAVLEAIAAERPKDPEPLLYLSRLQIGTGAIPAGTRTLRRAIALEPGNARLWAAFGEALLIGAKGEMTADVRAAFAQAQRLDPTAPEPRYYLARDLIDQGRRAEGLLAWRALAAELPADDPRRAILLAEISEVASTGRLPQPQAAEAASAADQAEQAQFIQAMVDRLAARLKANPDDPDGWARLIRAYGVLGQAERREAAIAEARRLFKDRPDDLRRALAEPAPAP